MNSRHIINEATHATLCLDIHALYSESLPNVSSATGGGLARMAANTADGRSAQAPGAAMTAGAANLSRLAGGASGARCPVGTVRCSGSAAVSTWKTATQVFSSSRRAKFNPAQMRAELHLRNPENNILNL